MTSQTGSRAATDDLCVSIADACSILAMHDHGDFTWGHVGARDPGGRGVWMKGSGLGFEEVRAADTVLVGWDGSVLEGDRPRHLEYPIHTEVLAARSDVNAVVHTHAHHSVAFGALGVPLRPISHDACFFGREGVAHFTATGDLITSSELGRSVADALGFAGACFLVNHGVVVVGTDVASATIGALLLERACRTQLAAMSAGGWATWSSDDELQAKHDSCYPPSLVAQAWEYCRRQVGATT